MTLSVQMNDIAEHRVLHDVPWQTVHHCADWYIAHTVVTKSPPPLYFVHTAVKSRRTQDTVFSMTARSFLQNGGPKRRKVEMESTPNLSGQRSRAN